MPSNRPVRVVKREQRVREKIAPAAPVERGEESGDRKLKTVVSGWVREHKERSEEYQRMFATLLRETGFRPSRA